MEKYLDLYVGGAFSGMAQSVDHASVVAFIDAQTEVAAIAQILRIAGITNWSQNVFPLAPGETLHGLLRHFTAFKHPFVDYAWKQPNTQLETGLGMEKLCGHLVLSLATSRGLMSFLETLYSLFFRLHNGMHSEVRLRLWAGLAGGTGPDVGRGLGTLLGEVVGAKSGSTTTVCLNRVGAFSFEGLGDRVWDNAAAALFEDLVWVLSPPHRKEEVRRLILVELPTTSTDGQLIGTSKEIRDSLASYLAQALSSRGVGSILDRRNPNLDLSPSGYGTIRLVQADWFYAISPLIITFSAAHWYKSSLERFNFDVSTLLTDAANLPEIKVDVYPNEDYIKSAKELAESLLNSVSLPERGQFEDQVKGIRSFDARVLFEYHGQRRKESIKQDLENPKSVQHYVSSLQHLLGIIETVEDKIRAYQLRKVDAEQEVYQAEKRLKAALALWYPESMGDKLRSAVSSVAGKLNSLEQAILIYRAKAEKLAEISKAIDTLEGVLLGERREFEEFKNRPLTLNENLTRILVQSVEPDKLIHLDWFVFRTLDEVFVDLLANRRNLDALRHLLSCRCPKSITLSGLGQIADVQTDASPDRILSSLLNGIPQFRGPHWGGGTPSTDSEESIIVSPPLSPGTFGELNDALCKTQMGNGIFSIAEADSFVTGANILILRIYKVSHPWDVITQPYFYRIQAMDRDRFFIDWNGIMEEPRWKKIYETLCQHYQLDE